MKFRYLLTYIYHIKEVCLLNVKCKRRNIFKEIHKSYTYQNQVPSEVVDMEFDIFVPHTLFGKDCTSIFFKKTV